MSAVTVALLVGFVACALLIRARGAQSAERRSPEADADRVRMWRAADV
ncbi:hypothetical protein [Nocardia sp. NPDC052566]